MAESKKTPPPTQPVSGETKMGAEVPKDGKPPVRVSYSPNAADQTVYTDGVQGIAVIGGVARIELYQVIVPAADKQPEQRIITHRLVMPLAGLGEFARILNSVGVAIKQASDKAKKMN